MDQDFVRLLAKYTVNEEETLVEYENAVAKDLGAYAAQVRSGTIGTKDSEVTFFTLNPLGDDEGQFPRILSVVASTD